MKTSSRIFIAGHRGLVGSAIVRKLRGDGFQNLVMKSRQELDLLDQAAVHHFFKENAVEYVFIAAAKVGGIYANSTKQADFLYENLLIATNIIHASAQHNVEKLLFLGSSCLYPRLAPQPIKEESLLSAPIEKTNEGYAIAKIAGLKLCEMYQRQYGKRFISAMPTSLYGIGDNFHPDHSHVIPGMLGRFHRAKLDGASQVVLWGTGTPKREFLNSDDLANALCLLMNKYESPETINVGSETEHSIRELANLIKDVVGYHGDITFDSSKPDGTPRKILDSSRIKNIGWVPEVELSSGVRKSYEWAKQSGKI